MKDFAVIGRLKDEVAKVAPNFKSFNLVFAEDNPGMLCVCCSKYTKYRVVINYTTEIKIPICDNFYCLAFYKDLQDFYINKFIIDMSVKERYKIFKLISENLLTKEIALFDNKKVVPVKLRELRDSSIYPVAKKIFKKYPSRAIYIFDGSALISRYRECSSCKREVKTENLHQIYAVTKQIKSDHYLCKNVLECDFCSSLL